MNLNDGENLVADGSISSVKGEFTSVPYRRPDTLRVDALPSTLKLAPAEPADGITHGSIIALYFLKNGLDNGLITVKSLYKMLRDIAFQTQQDGDVAFFELYPKALIRTSAETAADPQPSRAHLIANYKLYCKRLAHWYYHYIQCDKLWTGSVINLVNLARLNGNERTKTIATAFKPQTWKSKTNQFSSFPQPTGYTKVMMDAARIAIGHNTFGSQMAAVPIILTSIYGNLGQHTMTIADLLTDFNSSASGDPNYNLEASVFADADTNTNEDATQVNKLVARMMKTIDYYANESDSPWKSMPRDPYIENGSVDRMLFSDDDEQGEDVSALISGVSKLNASGNVRRNNFITAQSDNYEFWQDVMLTFFQEMRDPASDKYVIARDLLKIIETQFDYQDITDYTKKLRCYSMESLMEKMAYKDKCAVNTATLIRYMPPCTDSLSSPLGADGDLFNDNWMRYDVDSADYAAVIHKSKEYPSLTPTLFFDAAKKSTEPLTMEQLDKASPICINAISTIGAIGDIASPARAPLGKYSTILDYVTSQGVDDIHQEIQTIGYAKTAMEDYLRGCNALICPEDPSVIHASEPLLDTTDIFFCGFTLLISADSADRNEWTDYFKVDKYFPGIAESKKTNAFDIPENVPGLSWATGTKIPTQPAYTIASNGQCGIAHTANPDYLAYINHACIFIGGAIFNHPFLQRQAINSGNPVTYFAGMSDELLSKDMPVPSSPRLATNKHLYWTSQSDAMEDLAIRLYNESFSSARPIMAMMRTMYAIASAFDALKFDGVHTPGDQCRPQYGTLYAWIIAHDLEGCKSRFEHYLFDPSYGPVAPVTKRLPIAGFVPSFSGVSDPNDVTDAAAFAGIIPRAYSVKGIDIAAGFMSPADYSGQFSSMNFDCSYNRNSNAAMYYLHFIDAIRMKAVRATSNGAFLQIRIPELVQNPTFMSTESKSVLSLLSRSHSEGSIHDNLKAFFNTSSFEDARFKISALDVKDIDFDLTKQIVVPPRVPRKISNYDNTVGGVITNREPLANNNDGNGVNKDNGGTYEQIKSENESAATGKATGKHNGHNKKGSGKFKHHRPFNGSKRPDNIKSDLDGTAGTTEIKPESTVKDPTTDNKTKFDSTSMDEKAKKENNKVPNSSIQKMISDLV